MAKLAEPKTKPISDFFEERFKPHRLNLLQGVLLLFLVAKVVSSLILILNVWIKHQKELEESNY